MAQRSRKWTEEDEKLLRKSYPKISAQKLASRFKVTVADLNKKLTTLGLVKKAGVTAVKAAPSKKKVGAAPTRKSPPPKNPKKAVKTAVKKVAASGKASTAKAGKARDIAPPVKRVIVVPPPARVNLRCRYCFLVDGYLSSEKACHYCGADIYEIDSV